MSAVILSTDPYDNSCNPIPFVGTLRIPVCKALVAVCSPFSSFYKPLLRNKPKCGRRITINFSPFKASTVDWKITYL